jgi:hypothetical protein
MLKAIFKILGTIAILPVWCVALYFGMVLLILGGLPIVFVLDSAGVNHNLEVNPEKFIDKAMQFLDWWKTL